MRNFKEDEYNSQVNLETNDNPAKSFCPKDELSNPTTYETNPLETKKKKSFGLLSNASVAAAIVLGGGCLVGIPALVEESTSFVKFEILECDSNFVYIEFETTEKDLTGRVFNDFENIELFIDYYESENSNATGETTSNNSSSDYYTGCAFVETLKANTSYKISFESKSLFGKISLASSSFRTLKIEEIL